ncbi:MAG: hypothetical protein ACQETK_10975 [Pseudomonadota bacterium]
MRKAEGNLLFTAALALLALWSNPAVSMMGYEGPAPCESKACFIDAVSSCKAEASYVTATGAGASVQYLVEGAAETEGCKLGMIYMQHPESEWTYKPLHFVLDPDGDIDAQLKDAVDACLSGQADAGYQCSGPLLEISGPGGGR